MVAGPSEVRENTVEKFLGEKRSCSLGALLPLAVSHKPPLDEDLTHPHGKDLAEETQLDLFQHILPSLTGNNQCL